MTDFSQDGIVANIHDFKIRKTEELENELFNISKKIKMELILPCLYSETEGKALPKILNEINKTKYINHIIIGNTFAKKLPNINSLPKIPETRSLMI